MEGHNKKEYNSLIKGDLSMNRKRLLLLSALAASMALPSCGGAPASSSGGGSTEPGYTDVTSSSSTTPTTSTTTPGGDDREGREDMIYQGKLRIWYHRDDMNYDGLAIYLWNTAVDGKEYEWSGEDEEYGVYFDIDLATNEQFKDFPSTDIRVIVKKAGSWAGQSLDTVCEFKKFDIEGEGEDARMNIYLAAGEGKLIDMFYARQDALGDHFEACYVGNDWKTIYISGAGTKGSRKEEDVGKIASFTLYGFTKEYYRLTQAEKRKKQDDFIIKTVTLEADKQSAAVSLTLDKEIDPSTQYEVRGYFAQDTTKLKKKAIAVYKLFDTDKFKTDYTYTGKDLGVTVKDGKKTFKVWAPTSSRMRVCFYMFGTPWNLRGSTNVDSFIGKDMTLGEKGVWSLEIELDFDWYCYEATNSNGVVYANDPYAKASGLNGERNYCLDWDDASKVDPEGWNDGKAVNTNLPKIKSANELTVYETHIRDLTADETWISKKGNRRGGYNAFVEEGTEYTKNGKTVKTGFDHIKELGVNAIQLLPVFDQDNDERISSNYTSTEGNGTLDTRSYNWGYNPQNYNSVEGAYSSDPEVAATRIKEFKNLILKASENGIRIVMDVVYNHMSSVANNCFTKLIPYYSFRMDANGNYTDGSGCGNEVATERPMMSKYIADSVAWWANEYQIKGFRFDLMGCIDLDTMKAVRAAVNEIDPTIVLYGEGWTGGGTALPGDKQSGTNNIYKQLNTDANFPIGGFNDAGRDGAKGNTVYDDVIPAKGWICEPSNVNNVYNTLTQIIGENRWAKEAIGAKSVNPNQTVNYLACHDNYTLYDQINYHFYSHDSTFDDPNHEYVMQACTGLSAISLMSQGIGFIHGGDEFFRQKLIEKDDYWYDELVASYRRATNGQKYWIEGDGIKIDDDTWLVRNSYKYGDAVNSFKWDRLIDTTVDKYYQKFVEMVALRNKEMGNTLGQTEAQIKNDGCTCWNYNDLFDDQKNPKTDVIAGAYKGYSDDKSAYIFANKGNGAASIGFGNGTYTVLYSSNNEHPVGQDIVIDSSSIQIAKFETLILRAK